MLSPRTAGLILPPSVVSAIVILGVAVLAFAFIPPSAAFADPEDGQVTVLELFTSQGCSSCPPADKLLGQLAERKGVVALSLPVGYWDYLGWKDTLADPSYTDRQRHYSEGWGEPVYTPELVVNGLVGVVGSDQHQIESAIAKSLRMIDGSRAPVALKASGDDLMINVGAAPSGATYRSGVVWIAWLTRWMAVDVKKGENKGRQLGYHNVVRKMKRVGAWAGAPESFRVSRELAPREGYDLCVAMVQADDGGPILGAAQQVVKPPETAKRD